jgi:hypothetical protein
MASPYQQQALRRKLIYIGLIVALFTVSGVFRAYVVEARADELALREQNLGDVRLSSSALQLSLTGSRGFVVSALWTWALDAQKKNRWNELELYTNSLTQLQPHFITPWLFQSWNLSYNVSVEADQVKDKYFYVVRGVLLLEEGERRNRYHPDMRYNVGFYQQHKIMQSDETNYFRCLYQMSCIPFPQRDPQRFWKDVGGRRELDMAAFEEFCVNHPQFVRRLHDRLRCSTPERVVIFLDDNKDIPSLYVDDPDKAGAEWRQGHFPKKPEVAERFPALPPTAAEREAELVPRVGVLYEPNELSYESELTRPRDDSFDAYAGARAWFCYALEAVPPPHPTNPGETSEIVDRTRQRKPKMSTSLFRNHAPRAQFYVAERLQDEGWFGPEGWLITGWFGPRNRFPSGGEARVGTDIHWGEEAWKEANRMWVRRGRDSHLLLDPQEEADLRARAKGYEEAHKVETGVPPPSTEPPADDPEHDGWVAARKVHELDAARSLPNFMHFYHRSLVEMEPEQPGPSLIEARRTLFTARQFYREGHRTRAAEQFESKTGLERLRLILERYEDFRKDQSIQDEFYELELRYIKLMQELNGGEYKQLMLAGRLLGGGVPPGPAPVWPALTDLALTDPGRMSNLSTPLFLPAERMRLEAPGKDGKPFILPGIQEQVRIRHGLLKPFPKLPPGMQMPTPPPGTQMPPGMQVPPGFQVRPEGGDSSGGPPPG